MCLYKYNYQNVFVIFTQVFGTTQSKCCLFFRLFKPFSVHTNSGTALQERAHTIASRNETIHSLLVNLSLETNLEGRAEGRDEIYVVAQKTATTV
jgi:hypothetical protein